MNEMPFMKKSCKKFETRDPWNDNMVKGYLKMNGKLKYGSLWITHVNGEGCPQFVQGMPKLDYPYDEQSGGYDFGRSVSSISVYEKLDGTNILLYSYRDAEGGEYISYKTRRMPFMKDDFKVMWDEMLEKYPDIPYSSVGWNKSFELYGNRNHHSVRYDVDLDTKRLAYIRYDEKKNQTIIKRPNSIKNTVDDAPNAELITTISPHSHLGEKYEKIREWLEEHNKTISEDMDDFEITGYEGAVFYITHSDTPMESCSLYKCKPDTIQDFHWKISEGIPKHSIYNTVINAFEETDDVDYSLVKELLEEEYPPEEIERKDYHIKKVIKRVKADKALAERIIPEYDRAYELNPGFDIRKDKGRVMRHFAEKMDEWGIPKGDAGRVFSILKRNRGFSNA